MGLLAPAFLAIVVGGCTNHDSAPPPYVAAGLSVADEACQQLTAHRYLKAARTINIAARQGTRQWADLALAIRTVAWTNWPGDVGRHLTQDQAVRVITTSCTKVSDQTDGASFEWEP